MKELGLFQKDALIEKLAASFSCFVWDKRATQQQIIVRHKSEIVGFYRNPTEVISQQQALEIVGAIARNEISTNY